MNDNLKWLLLIPIIIVTLVIGFLITSLFNGGDDGAPLKQTNPALDVEIEDAGERIDSYENILAGNPTDVDAVKGLADSYLEKGSLQAQNGQLNEAYVTYKGAIDNYRKYLAANPAGQEARIDLGLTYLYMNMPDIAERELITTTQFLPTDQRAWHTLAFVEMQGLGKEKEAIAAWQKAYSLNPTSEIGVESKSFIDQLSTPVGTGTEITVPPAP